MPRSDSKLPIKVIRVPEGFISDGDGGKPPSGLDIPYIPDDGVLLHTIGRHLAKAQGRDTSKYDFKLDRFPQGYTGWSKARPANNRPPDKYIYGHPSKANFFDSGALFARHINHRTKHGNSTNCGCKPCENERSRTSGRKYRASDIDEDIEYENAATSFDDNTASEDGSALAEHQNIIEVLGSSQNPAVHDNNASEEQEDMVQVVNSSQRSAVDDAYVPDSIIGDSVDDDLRHRSRSLSSGRITISSYGDESSSMLPASQHNATGLIDELLDRAKKVKIRQHFGEVITAKSCLYGLEDQVNIEAQLNLWHSSPDMLRSGEIVIYRAPDQSELNAAASPGRSNWVLGVIAATKEAIDGNVHIEVRNLERAEPSQRFSTNNVYPLRFISFLDRFSSRVLEQKAQTLICKCSLVSAFHFKGEREHLSETLSTLSFAGIYIGAELLLLGDYARLMPRTLEQDGSTITDIMLIQAIQLRVIQSEDNEEGHIACHVSGRVLTTDRNRAFKINGRVQLCSDEEAQKVLGEVDTLYWRTNPDVKTSWVEIPFTRILGRYHHAKVHASWLAALGQTQIPCSISSPNSHLSFGLHDTLRMRQRAHRNHSSRGKAWQWDESRLL